jgi:hypothetical protein
LHISQSVQLFKNFTSTSNGLDNEVTKISDLGQLPK